MSADRGANYAGVFDGHLLPGQKAALVIVDVVMAYLDPTSPFYAATAPAALAANVRLVARAREIGVPIAFTKLVIRNDGIDGGHFYRKVPSLKAFVQGSPLGAFPPDLQPESTDLIVAKHYPSAFFGTTLASTLHAMRVDTVLLTGFSTSGCVRASALDALQHGFIPFVIADACADRHPGPHEANLFDLQAKYAEVIAEAEAIKVMTCK